jgi:cell division protein FtsI (penicillin-binding protein 3)
MKANNQRVSALYLIFILIFVIFAARLVQVQGISSSAYAARASKELYKTAPLAASRGAITDKDGVPFARSIAAVNITVDQQLVLDPARAAVLIAPLVQLPIATVQASLTGDRRFAYVAKDVSPATWKAVKEAIASENSHRAYGKYISGFYAEDAFHRDYPAGALGASFLGFVNASGHGGGGIEYALDSVLAGKDGSYTYAQNGGGQIIPTAHDVLTPASGGKDVRLTIDRDIQWVAQQAITAKVKESGALSGTVIVMDPKTGKILAMATAPTFDPNNLAKATPDLLATPAVSDPYEPGSTGKVMTMAAAIEEKLVTPTTLFTVPDKIKRANHFFGDHDKHATWTLTTAGILAKSSNTGTIQIGEKLKPTTLHSYLTKFGIGQKTGLELAGESGGVLAPVDRWSGTTAPTVAFGQGYSLTTIQATSVVATIANDGVKVKPTLVSGYVDQDGHYSPKSVTQGVRIISSDTAQKVRLMMESVLSDEGTAPGARIPGYRVAGKTGTANRIDSSGHYHGYTASFIGFAPAENPQFVINVTIQDPHGVHFGSLLGGPVFKEVMSFALKTYRIPPSSQPVTLLPMNEKELKSLSTKKIGIDTGTATKA